MGEQGDDLGRGLTTVARRELKAIAHAGACFDAQVDGAITAQEGRALEPPAGDIERDISAPGKRKALGGNDQAGGENVVIGPDQDLPFPFDAFALKGAPGLATRSPGVGDWSRLVRRRRHRASPRNWRCRVPGGMRRR